MTDNRDKGKPRGERSVLGSEKEFKKDEANSADDVKKDEQAKDDVGRMGEASRQNKRVDDAR